MAASPTRIAAEPRSLVGALLAVAAVALAVLSLPSVAESLDHERSIAGTGGLSTLGLFLVGWTLMMLAMMLPSAATLLGAMGRLTDARGQAFRWQATTSSAYLAVWLAIGYLFRAGDVVVHTLVDRTAWLAANDDLVAAGVLFVAGAFQFSDVKRKCVTACRTPTTFIYRNWRGERPTTDAARVGVSYGLSCVGCCWALMLVMFAFGAMSPWWMLLFGTVMAAEKSTRWGGHLTAPLGIALLAAAVFVAL